jgi:ankyrin repeat protein
MPTPLPARPDLGWLRKRAKDTLATLRKSRPGAKLAEAQLAVAREHGFSSWRALKTHIDALHAAAAPVPTPLPESLVAELLRTVGGGDLARVEAMLREHPSLVNAIGPHPYWGGRPQPLHVAIETNRPEMVKLLLRHGADVRGQNAEYLHWSPLLLTYHWGEGRGRTALRRMLVARGAKPGLVELMVANDEKAVLRRLKAGRSALPREVPNGGSLLMFARSPKVIDRLLELGVSLEQRDRWGADPMEGFSRMGPKGTPLVRHLLARGVAAPPAAFARLNDRATIRTLLAQDPSRVKDPSLLKGAVDFGHHALAEWLLSQGADPNARTGGEDDSTVLHSAAWGGDAKLVELLLRHGADPTIRDRQYDGTPAGWAATSVEVTNNPKCAAVAERLARAEQDWQGRGAGH